MQVSSAVASDAKTPVHTRASARITEAKLMKKTIVQGHALQYVTTRKDSVIIPKETFDLCHGRSANTARTTQADAAPIPANGHGGLSFPTPLRADAGTAVFCTL